MKCKDGTIAFGTYDGQLIFFNPKNFQDENNIESAVITDIKIINKSAVPGEKSILKKAAYLADTLRLNYQQSVITFDLANMDFINPDIFSYAYQLENFDKDWIIINDRNSITYTNLDPGTYYLHIKQANHLGVWNQQPETIVLIIDPPWYKTGWFRLLAGVLIIGMILIVVRFYTNRKLQKQKAFLEKQKAIELERMRISTELHDDMGGELSAICLLSEMNSSAISPQQQLSKISSSSGDLVQKMNEIVWALNVNNDSLQSLIAYIRRYSVKYLDDVGIECSFKQPGNIPEKELDGKTRRNIFLVIKETLNNVVKHAHATTVNITIDLQDSLHITIHDNGKGIPQEMIQNGTGNGLRNMQQRVQELQGKMEIKNHQGTAVQFIIPLAVTQKGY